MAISEQRFVAISDDVRIAYEIRARTGDEPPILALHGVLVGTSNWIHQALRLPEFRWLLPSMRGHGESTPVVERIDIETAALDMMAVLENEGIERAVVIGNSLGATVALALGLMAPERASALVLVEPSIPSLVSDRAKQRLIQEVELTRELLDRGEVDEALGQFVEPRLGERWTEKIGRRRLEEWRRNIWYAPAWLDAVVEFNPGVGPLSALQPPTLIMHGEQTHSFYRDLTEAVADSCPHEQLVILPDAGHGAPVDNPDAFNQVLKTFLARIPA